MSLWETVITTIFPEMAKEKTTEKTLFFSPHSGSRTGLFFPKTRYEAEAPFTPHVGYTEIDQI